MPACNRACAVLMLSLFMQACRVWRPAPTAPRPFLQLERPSRIRITTNDGTTTEVKQPFVINDEIRTVVRRCHHVRLQGQMICDLYSQTLTVANLDDVRVVEIRRISWGRTLALVAVDAGLFYLALDQAGNAIFAGG